MLVVKLMLQVLVLELAGLPAIVWYLAYRSYAPHGFWEGLGFWSLTGWFLGTFQLGGLIAVLGSLYALWVPRSAATKETTERAEA